MVILAYRCCHANIADMFVSIKSSVASFLVGTICFKLKFHDKDEVGHLIKSPTKKTCAFGYNTSAESSFAVSKI